MGDIVTDLLCKPYTIFTELRNSVNQALDELKPYVNDIEQVLLEINKYKNSFQQIIVSLKAKVDSVKADAQELDTKVVALESKFATQLDSVAADINAKMNPLLDTMAKYEDKVKEFYSGTLPNQA